VSLDEAEQVYEKFMARKADRVIPLSAEVKMPSRWGAIGQAIRLWYESWKWRTDGAVGFYVHTYESAVEFCEPWRAELRPVAGPKGVRELVYLGRCVGVEIMLDDGKVRYPELAPSTLLCATPDGRSLVFVDPKRGIRAALLGGAQTITAHGVEG